MKKTPLKRKTPLKAKTGLVRRPKPKNVSRGQKRANKSKSMAHLKKKLDAVFSKYIRKRDDGQCFTCPKKDDPKRMQAGHFVPRQYLAVRFNEKNVNCQCYACNVLYGGQGATYAIRLAEKYDQETVEWLESQRWVTTKLTPEWYEEQIAHYTNLL